MPPKVIHLVISLAPGGLERLVVDWTNARNRRFPGSTSICCLDSLGDLASQVEGEAVCCVNAKRARWPFDGAAVRKIRQLLSYSVDKLLPAGAGTVVSCSVAKLLSESPEVSPSSATQQPNNLTTTRANGTTQQPNNPTTNSRDSAATQQPNNPTTDIQPQSVVVHAHNLAAWQYGVLAKLRCRLSLVWGGCPHPSSSPFVWGGCPHPPDDPGGNKADGDIRPTRGTGQADGDIRPTRGTGQADGDIRPTRETGQADGDIRPTREAGQADGDIRPTREAGQADGDIRPTQETKSSFRLIYTQHGANVHNLGMRDRLRARLLACFTDEIVTVSKATAEVMSKKLWIARKRIKVVVNGVAAGKKSGVSSQKSGIREQLGITSNSRLIGAVGRLAWVKGHDRLIRAFATFVWGGCPHPPGSDQDPKADGDIRPTQEVAGQADGDIRPTQGTGPIPVYLLLIGDGPERVALEKQACDLGIADRVIFAGYQADPGPYLAAMDVFVLPSRSEGLSVSLLEAMIAGVPVAVTNVGANREVIDDGKCGVILPDDETHWPAILLAVLKDTERTQFRSSAALTRVQTHYSLTATLDGYEALYREGLISPLCVGRMSPSA